MKYAVIVHWSEEDGVFIASILELPGVQAHGDSQEAAVREVFVAAALAVNVLTEDGRPIPKPLMGREHLLAFMLGCRDGLLQKHTQTLLDELARRATMVELGETIQGGPMHGASRFNLHRWAADQIADITGLAVEPTDPEAG